MVSKMIGKKFKCVNCGKEFFSKEQGKLKEVVVEAPAYCDRCRKIIGKLELKKAIRDKRKRDEEKFKEVTGL